MKLKLTHYYIFLNLVLHFISVFSFGNLQHFYSDSILSENTNDIVWKEEIIAQNITAFESRNSQCHQPVLETELKRICKPSDLQFYPRDKQNQGSVRFAGTLNGYTDFSLKILKIKNDSSIDSSIVNINIDANNDFDTTIKINSELCEYYFKYKLPNDLNYRKIADKVVVGDAYIISGQSNAAAIDTSKTENRMLDSLYGKKSFLGKYGRCYGNAEYNFCRSWNYVSPANYTGTDWCSSQIGTIGIRLQYNLIQKYQVPICLLNNSLGGSRIEDHILDTTVFQNNQFYYDYYHCENGLPSWSFRSAQGFLFRRVYLAGIQNNIKAYIWYQGESDIASYGNYPSYSQKLEKLHRETFQFLPNLEKFIIVQLHSNPRNEDSLKIIGLTEEQRYFSFTNNNTSIVSTNSIKYPNCSGSHFNTIGYFELAERITKQLSAFFYNNVFDIQNFPPNIIKIELDKPTNKLILTFNQDIESNSDVPEDIAKAIYTSNNCKLSNTIIKQNKLITTVNNTNNLNYISYLGHLPCHNNNVSPGCNSNDTWQQSYSYNWWCPVMIKNNQNIGALSFGNFPVDQICFSCYDFNSDNTLVFPNPTSNGVVNVISNYNPIELIEVYNLVGENICVFDNISSNQTTIQLPNTSNEFLVLRIKYANGETISKKILTIN